MRIASFLLVGITAIPVTLSAQQVDSNTIESASKSGWSEEFTIAGFSGHDGGRNAFIYDDRRRRMAPLSGGLNAISVDAVALGRDGLWFGGEIAEAGSGETRIPSVGVAQFRFGR